MATRSALLAALLLALPSARAAAADPPAALLVPAGPASPVDPAPAEATPQGASAIGEAAPRITEVAEVPAAADAAPSPAPPAGEAPAAAPPPEPLTPSQRETLRFQMKSYLRQVHERVQAVWAAPVGAASVARREALVTVVIGRDGRVVETRVDRSSLDAGFDRSALRALGRPYLFPPLPSYYETEALEVGLRFADPVRRRR